MVDGCMLWEYNKCLLFILFISIFWHVSFSKIHKHSTISIINVIIIIHKLVDAVKHSRT